jgi:hypothetical protein
MRIEITYPNGKNKQNGRGELIRWMRYPFILAAMACIIVNVATKGKLWSVVVLWAMFMAWRDIFSIDLVEFNRISQFIKIGEQTCVLLVLIDLLLAPGWAQTVVPIVCFGILIIAGLLFFSDMEKQKHNMMPMVFLSFVSLVLSLCLIFVWKWYQWPVYVMASLSFVLLSSCIVILGKDFSRSLKKYFHTR